jgi:hypothetical protein
MTADLDRASGSVGGRNFLAKETPVWYRGSMAEPELPPEPTSEVPPKTVDIDPKKDEPSSSAKLLDAGLLVFLVSASSFIASILYVGGLSVVLGFPLQSYFQLADYLRVTPYWLGPAFGLVLVFAIFSLHGISILVVRKELKRGSEAWAHWIRTILALLLIAVLLLAWFTLLDLSLAIAGVFIIIASWTMRNNLVWASTLLSGRIGKRRWIHAAVRIGFPMALTAVLLGAFWTPALMRQEKTSEIYLLSNKGEPIQKPIKAQILFSLTEYLIAYRDEDVFEVIPSARIERIETPVNPLRQSPWLTWFRWLTGRLPRTLMFGAPSPTRTPSPIPSTSPAPSASATIPPTPTPSPSMSPTASPSPSASKKPLRLTDP